MKKLLYLILFISFPVITLAQDAGVNYPEGWEDLPQYEEYDPFAEPAEEADYYDEYDNYDEFNDPSAQTIHDHVQLVQDARGKMRQNRAKVVDVSPMDESEWSQYINAGAYGGFHYILLFLDGDYKGRQIVVDFIQFDEDLLRVGYEKGDRVVVGYILGDDGEIIEPGIYGKDRLVPVILLMVLFIAAVMVLGRKQGALSLLALFITILLIFMLYIPMVMNGYSPLFWAIVLSVISTGLTFIIISGFTRKTVAALTGSLVGFITATIVMLIFGSILKITGVMDSNLIWIVYSTDLNISQIIFSAIIIGAIGAVMDVAISMASTVEELKKANPGYTQWQLFTSSLNVGKDMMGTMVNTLILAYVGTSLPFIILIYLQYSGAGFLNILNLEVISQEILRSVIGSLGMFATIPATGFVAAYLTGRKAN